MFIQTVVFVVAGVTGCSICMRDLPPGLVTPLMAYAGGLHHPQRG